MESTDIKKSRKAALDFLKIGRKKEHKNNASNNEKGIDLYYKYKDMSDDDFKRQNRVVFLPVLSNMHMVFIAKI